MGCVPFILELEGVPVLVVGAGRVAERRIGTLLRAGARVRVAAPEATRRVRALARRRSLRWVKSSYRPALLRDAVLVLAVTSDPAVNHVVALDARRRRRFVSVADDASLSNLILPAVLRRGPLVVAVSTSGESPALARRLRDEVAARIGPEYGAYLRLVGSLRRRLRKAVADPAERGRRYRSLLRAPLLRLLRSGRVAGAARAGRRAAGLS